MSIKYAVGDYVIVEQDKKHLVQVLDADPVESRGVIEHTRVTGEDLTLEFSEQDVVSCLGPKPKVGSVHGIRVEIWERTIETPLGECDFYYKPPKEFRASLTEAFDKMERRLKKWKCDSLLPVTLEVRVPKGKATTGWYHPHKGRDGTDKIILHPASDSTLNWLICHEFGHPIWQKLLTTKIRAAWVRKYYADVKLGEVGPEDCENLLEAILAAKDGNHMKVREIASDLDDDALDQLEMCMGWMKDFHYLRPVDVMTLALGGHEKLIRKIWPKGAVMTTDKEVRVSEYGNKNAEEWFAEALAMHYCGMSLPEDIKELLDKTLAYLKGRE